MIKNIRLFMCQFKLNKTYTEKISGKVKITLFSCYVFGIIKNLTQTDSRIVFFLRLIFSYQSLYFLCYQSLCDFALKTTSSSFLAHMNTLVTFIFMHVLLKNFVRKRCSIYLHSHTIQKLHSVVKLFSLFCQLTTMEC